MPEDRTDPETMVQRLNEEIRAAVASAPTRAQQLARLVEIDRLLDGGKADTRSAIERLQGARHHPERG